MNLTSTNIANGLLLAKCCYADYAIDYLQKRNIGDNEQASCYLSKMKQLYYSMQALNQFVPAAELAPTFSSLIYPNVSTLLTGSQTIYIDGVQISPLNTFSSQSYYSVLNQIVSSINIYQSNYLASISGAYVVLTSILSGTTNNGYEVSIVQTFNGTSFSGVIGTLSGGTEQWCLTDTKAKKIIENIDQLCGCPCGDCDDILDDTLPRYITN